LLEIINFKIEKWSYFCLEDEGEGYVRVGILIENTGWKDGKMDFNDNGRALLNNQLGKKNHVIKTELTTIQKFLNKTLDGFTPEYESGKYFDDLKYQVRERFTVFCTRPTEDEKTEIITEENRKMKKKFRNKNLCK
jgi:hypothetical protein